MAEYVLRSFAEQAGLDHIVKVDSAGTGDWHVGEPADHRALSALRRRGYDGSAHRARQFDPHWFATRNLVVALDHDHLRTLRSWAANDVERARIHLLRSFDPTVVSSGASAQDLDVHDPYYENLSVYEDILAQIEPACAGLLDHVRGKLDDLPRYAR
jgi:protein-tyrosine phosphatase